MDLNDMDTMQLCEDLATAFNKIVHNNKQILPQFDELIGKGSKFQKDLKATLVSLCSFLDIFQQIADGASATSGSNRDSGTVMTRIVLRQRAFENHLKDISKALEDSVLVPLQSKPEEWKKSVILLERQHAKDLKLIKVGIKQNTDQLTKLRKKSKKDPSQLLYKQQAKIHEELHAKYMALEAQERKAVRRINKEERLHFTSLMRGFKPVIQQQTRMISSLEKLREMEGEIIRFSDENSDKDATEETILRNMNPRVEVLTPTTSLINNQTTTRLVASATSSTTRLASSATSSTTRSPASATSSVESLSETDVFMRAPHRRNGELEQTLDGILYDKSISSALYNEAPIAEDSPEEIYSGLSTPSKPLQHTHRLHRQNSGVARYGSPQRYEVPLTNIEEHRVASHAAIPPNCAANKVLNIQPFPNNVSGRGDISTLDQSIRCEDSPNPEQINKDDASSEGSQLSSSGYGSPGDDCIINTGTTSSNRFDRTNPRRASFSTFSPISSPFTRNTNFPSRRHSFRDTERHGVYDETFSRGSFRRQSFYTVTPSIPENEQQLPPNNQNYLSHPTPQQQYYQASQQQHYLTSKQQNHSSPQHLHHQASHPQHHTDSQQQHHPTSHQQHHPVPQQQNRTVSQQQHEVSCERTHEGGSDSWINCEIDPVTIDPVTIDPVTNQIEVFPFNDVSMRPRCLHKNVSWHLNNSTEDGEEILPPPPNSEHNRSPPPNSEYNRPPPPNREHNRSPPPNSEYNRPPPPNTEHNRPPPPNSEHNRPPPPNNEHKRPPPPNSEHNRPPPTNSEHNRPPPPNSEHNRPPPPNTEHNRPPPPNSEHNRPPPPNTDHNRPPPPNSEHKRPPPPNSDHNRPPPPNSEHNHPPPPKSKNNHPPPPNNEHDCPPPPNSEHNHPPPLHSEHNRPHPLNSEHIHPPPDSENNPNPPDSEHNPPTANLVGNAI